MYKLNTCTYSFNRGTIPIRTLKQYHRRRSTFIESLGD